MMSLFGSFACSQESYSVITLLIVLRVWTYCRCVSKCGTGHRYLERLAQQECSHQNKGYKAMFQHVEQSVSSTFITYVHYICRRYLLIIDADNAHM